MKYRPNLGRILLRKLDKPDYVRINSGIVVPGEGIMNRELERGEVIAGTAEIKTGQIVWYSSYSASHFYDQKEGSFFCLSEEDVMVFEDKENDGKKV